MRSSTPCLTWREGYRTSSFVNVSTKEEGTMSSVYSVGLMNQLGDALEAAGYTAEDVTRLRGFGQLASVKLVMAGLAEISILRHIIDCDAQPFVPNGWAVAENPDGTLCHIKGGQFEWNPNSIGLHLSDKQRSGVIEGNKLRKELVGKAVLNANVLDYLLAHPQLIPDEWKGKAIFFWGTIYRDSHGNLCVRYPNWYGKSRHWLNYWLHNEWYANYPAAVRK